MQTLWKDKTSFCNLNFGNDIFKVIWVDKNDIILLMIVLRTHTLCDNLHTWCDNSYILCDDLHICYDNLCILCDDLPN